MNRTFLFMILFGVGFVLGSCKKDDGGTGTTIPPPPDLTDFSFPASAATSATLYAPTTSVVVNQEFDVRFVLYNITDAFGTATEITYPADKVQATAEAINSTVFAPSSSTLVVKGAPSGTTGVYAYGVTYLNGSNGSQSGSGVVMKLRLKALAAGSATISLTKFELKRADGSTISLPTQSATVTIQ